MYKRINKNNSLGFAAVKLLLIAIIIVIIGGVLTYVFVQRSSTNSLSNSDNNSSSSSNAVIPDGTTSSITTLTEQDAQIEASVDDASDSKIQQDAASANNAASNLEGAYDASSF